MAATFAVQVALAEMWRGWGIEPHAILGHGRGEFAAACAAGLLSVEEAAQSFVACCFENQVAEVSFLSSDAASDTRPKVPLLFTATGRTLSDREALRQSWLERQDRFEQENRDDRVPAAIKSLRQFGTEVILSIGPTAEFESKSRTHEEEFQYLSSFEHDQDVWETILNTLATLYIRGVDVDWRGFDHDFVRRPVELPAYPFQHRTFWLSDEAGGEGSPKKDSDESRWYYRATWKQTGDHTECNSEQQTDPCLLLVDNDKIGKLLTKRLDEQRPICVVQPGTSFNQLDERTFTVAPDSPDDYQALFAELRRSGQFPNQIAHLWTIGETVDGSRDWQSEFEQNRSLGYASLLALAQAIGSHSEVTPVEILYVTSAVHDVTGTEPLRAGQAAALGPCMVIPQEYPTLSCRHADVLPPQNMVDTGRLVDQVLSELNGHGEERAVAYRGKLRFQGDYERVSPTSSANSLSIKKGGVYAIVGQLSGGLGLVWADYLTKKYQAKVALVSPDVASPKDEALVRQIAELEANADVLTVPAVLDDSDLLTAELQRIEEHFGNLHGVMFVCPMAASQSPRLIGELTPAISEQYFEKVYSLAALQSALSGRSLDFCLVQSSLSAVLGGLGLCAYAAASACLDQFTLIQNRQGGTPWISINWDAGRWELPESDASGAPMAEFALTVEEARRATDRVLQLSEYERLVVSTGDLAKRLQHELQRTGSTDSMHGLVGQQTAESKNRPDLETPYVAPRNDIERQIIEVWEEFLAVRPIGVHDNYFHVGGGSLAAIQIISRLRSRFQVEVPVRSILVEAPTAAGIAEAIERAQADSASAGEQRDQVAEMAELLAGVERLSPEEAVSQLNQDL